MFLTAASQNNLWLYADDNKLHLYNYQLMKELLQTQAITFSNISFLPENIVSTYKYIWILSKNGILEFNEYGVFIRGHNIKDAEQIFPFKKGLSMLRMEPSTIMTFTKFIPIELISKSEAKSTYINSSNIFMFDGRQVHEYQIKR